MPVFNWPSFPRFACFLGRVQMERMDCQENWAKLDLQYVDYETFLVLPTKPIKRRCFNAVCGAWQGSRGVRGAVGLPGPAGPRVSLAEYVLKHGLLRVFESCISVGALLTLRMVFLGLKHFLGPPWCLERWRIGKKFLHDGSFSCHKSL